LTSETNCVLSHREPKTAQAGLLVCHGHHRWLADALDDIIITCALLDDFREPGTAIDDGRQVRGKRVDPPAPIRLDVVALEDRRTVSKYPGDIYPVLAVLEGWARIVREERKLGRPKCEATILGEAGLLLAHLSWLMSQPFVDDLAGELRQVKSALHSAIGEHAPRPVGRCPVVYPETGTCDGPLYQDRYGGMSVSCRQCGEYWGETELRRLGLVVGA